MKKLVSTAACLLLAVLLSGCARKAMVLVTQYGPNDPRVAEMESAIRKQMAAENVPIAFKTVNMDIVGQPNPVWIEQQGYLAVSTIDAWKAEIVLIAGDETARHFAMKMIGKPFKMIYFDLVANPESYKLASSGQAGGVVADVPVREAFAGMKELVTNAQGVAVLADNSLEGDAIVAKIHEMKDLAVPVVLVKRAGTLAEWMAAVKEIQGKADLLCIPSYSMVLPEKESLTSVPGAELLRMTAAVNRLPDFSFWKEAVGPNGVMAAWVVPVSVQAAQATRMAADLLYYNSSLDSQPVLCSTHSLLVDADRAAAVGVTLPARLLPPLPPAKDEAAGKEAPPAK